MTTDLWCLVVATFWGWVLLEVEAVGKTRIAGTAWNMGNRDVAPEFPAWIQRAGRALDNHKENLPFFLVAVLVVHVAGKADRVSAVACVVYVLARAAHGMLYIAGITRVRSAAYVAGLVATLTVVSRLIL